MEVCSGVTNYQIHMISSVLDEGLKFGWNGAVYALRYQCVDTNRVTSRELLQLVNSSRVDMKYHLQLVNNNKEKCIWDMTSSQPNDTLSPK
jgi:hypothetical protein